MKVLLIITAMMIHNGNVVPAPEAIVLDSMQDCVALMSEIQRHAHEEGQTVYTTCTAPRKLEDYK